MCSFNTHTPNYLNGKYLNHEKGEYYKTIGLRSCFSPLMIIYKLKNKHVFGCRLFGTFFFTILICRPSTPVFDPRLGQGQTKCYQIVNW